uniref:Uncharacterized protein n=1 Tax=Globodera rostochiensis TaxID=31243 RepID=A0A914H3Y3_GLORO
MSDSNEKEIRELRRILGEQQQTIFSFSCLKLQWPIFPSSAPFTIVELTNIGLRLEHRQIGSDTPHSTPNDGDASPSTSNPSAAPSGPMASTLLRMRSLFGGANSLLCSRL